MATPSESRDRGPDAAAAAAAAQRANEERALLSALQSGARIEVGERGIVLPTLDDVLRFSKWVQLSGLAPRGVDTVAKTLLVLLKGREAGLSFMQSLASIDIIEGGTPAWKQKAALGMVRASGKLGAFARSWRGNAFDDDFAAVCVAMRRDTGEEMTSEFSVFDARQAKLWGKTTYNGKPTPWILYPKRQLYARSLGFLLQDLFGDVTGQWDTAEAARDWAAAAAEEVAERVRAEQRGEPIVVASAPPAASPALQALAAGAQPVELELPMRERELVPRAAPAAAAPAQLTLDVEPRAAVEGPLMPGIVDAIRRRVEAFLPDHRGRASSELERMVRERLAADEPVVNVLAAVRDWRPQWGV